MKNSQQCLSEVKKILEEAGLDSVSDTMFLLNDEPIFYWAGGYDSNKSGRYFVGNNSNNKRRFLEEIESFLNSVKQGQKSFLFYRLDSFDDFLFSLEFVNYDGSQMDILSAGDSNTVKASSADIIRIPRKNGNSQNSIIKAYMVAIRIGAQGNRDYTALKHYIISSDNRTYNHVVRNMTEYINTNFNLQQSFPNNKTEQPHNLLVSGAPGTGKSHYLQEEILKSGGATFQGESFSIASESIIERIKTTGNLDEKNAVKIYLDKYVTRVTFFEDYSYENFIGCYKPVPSSSTTHINNADQTGEMTEEKITYTFVSGPFINTYLKAMKDSEHSYFLIIEEINRAKAATVFGDMFQLLDRKDGVSEYDIKPDEALDRYLLKNLSNYNGTMKLPPNMYLWATMNSADQGVMPLDSAFKRRWAQMYMDINPDEGNARPNKLTIPARDGKGTILWENLRMAINTVILNNGFDEDRCIGSWYFSPAELDQINSYFNTTKDNRRNMVNPLIDKLLYYLRQDVFRRNPGIMFKTETDENPGLSMSDLRRRVRQGEAIDRILQIDNLKWEATSESVALK